MSAGTEAERRSEAPDRNEAAPPVIVVGLDRSPSSWDAFCWAVGPPSFVTEPGDVSRALADVAREANANLLVVGRSAKVWHRLAGSLGHRLTSRPPAHLTQRCTRRVVVP